MYMEADRLSALTKLLWLFVAFFPVLGHFNISEDLGTVSLNKTLELDVNVTFFLVIRASYTRVDLVWSRTRRGDR